MPQMASGHCKGNLYEISILRSEMCLLKIENNVKKILGHCNVEREHVEVIKFILILNVCHS